MENREAAKILNALANGAHPVTGEVFAADSPYRHPDTARALFAAVCALGSAPDDTEPDHLQATPSAFVPWTPEEEERLAAAFDAGKSSVELATLHNRSRAAIEARLLKLGKIDVSALTVQLRYRGAPAPR
jgi:hypothetical protein